LLAHDPRISPDRDHKVETSNIALVEAEFKRHDGGEIDWKSVASLANHCDNVAGSHSDRAKGRWFRFFG
jgi:hypothetical protein